MLRRTGETERDMTKKMTAVAMAGVTVLLLGACSKSSTPEPAPSTAAEPSAAPEAVGAITIVTTEYAFAIPEISAGSHELLLKNDGEQVHMAAVVQLLDGRTVEDVMTYIEEHGTGGKPPSWAMEIGFGIADPGSTSPIGSADGEPEPGAVLDLVAGDYVALCFIADGSMSMDQKPPKGAKTHAELGMIQGFTVT